FRETQVHRRELDENTRFDVGLFTISQDSEALACEVGGSEQEDAGLRPLQQDPFRMQLALLQEAGLGKFFRQRITTHRKDLAAPWRETMVPEMSHEVERKHRKRTVPDRIGAREHVQRGLADIHPLAR